MAIDWTKPVEVDDGRPVRVLATDLGGSHPVAVAILGNPNTLVNYTECGQGWHAPIGAGALRPLRNVTPKPVKREGFVVVGKDREGNSIAGAGVFATSDEAAALIGKALHWHGVARITWEDPAQ